MVSSLHAFPEPPPRLLRVPLDVPAAGLELSTLSPPPRAPPSPSLAIKAEALASDLWSSSSSQLMWLAIVVLGTLLLHQLVRRPPRPCLRLRP